MSDKDSIEGYTSNSQEKKEKVEEIKNRIAELKSISLDNEGNPIESVVREMNILRSMWGTLTNTHPSGVYQMPSGERIPFSDYYAQNYERYKNLHAKNVELGYIKEENQEKQEEVISSDVGESAEVEKEEAVVENTTKVSGIDLIKGYTKDMEEKIPKYDEIERLLDYLDKVSPDSEGNVIDSIEQQKDILRSMKGTLMNPHPSGAYQISAGVRQSFEDAYNEKFEKYVELNGKNVEAGYINEEEQEGHQLPEFDLTGFENKMQAISSEEDYHKVDKELHDIKGKHWKYADREKIDKCKPIVYLMKARDKANKDKVEQSEAQLDKEKNLPKVNISKFRQIYEGAKGKVKAAFDKIKSVLTKNKARDGIEQGKDTGSIQDDFDGRDD